MTVSISRVSSVVIFSEEWLAIAHWWANLTRQPLVRFPRSASIDLAGVEIVFSPTDERNPPGGSPLPYLEVADFNDARRELANRGCLEIHRPLAVQGGRQITQFRDPFGNIFGIEGALSGPDELWPEVVQEMRELRELYE
ncbi:VOC family protein [Micromonospora sp. NPDC048868]|uniref:VOC family protein n=1 Tax=Micromonospora sp. NPDC048868 TaxID=3364258 RepID=UPI003722C548